MGGGGPDDGIGARRAGAPSTIGGPGTELAPWQVGVGQERVEGEAGRTREAPEQDPIGVLQPAGAPHWAGLARSSSLRGSAFVIAFANFPGGPVPSGRSRGWSCQDSFEAPGVDCWDGEAKSKLQSLTWSVTTTPGSVITPPDGVTSVYPGPGT